MNKYRFLNHPDGKLDIVDAQVTFTDKSNQTRIRDFKTSIY